LTALIVPNASAHSAGRPPGGYRGVPRAGANGRRNGLGRIVASDALAQMPRSGGTQPRGGRLDGVRSAALELVTSWSQAALKLYHFLPACAATAGQARTIRRGARRVRTCRALSRNVRERDLLLGRANACMAQSGASPEAY
jgi:hypothetical protein